jgi:hypothetical protein
VNLPNDLPTGGGCEHLRYLSHLKRALTSEREAPDPVHQTIETKSHAWQSAGLGPRTRREWYGCSSCSCNALQMVICAIFISCWHPDSLHHQRQVAGRISSFPIWQKNAYMFQFLQIDVTWRQMFYGLDGVGVGTFLGWKSAALQSLPFTRLYIRCMSDSSLNGYTSIL